MNFQSSDAERSDPSSLYERLPYERNYQFRRRLERVHKPNRRKAGNPVGFSELCVEDGWRICIASDAGGLVQAVAKDLQDYFYESMNLSLLLVRSADLGGTAKNESGVIVLGTGDELTDFADGLSVPRSYRLVCSSTRILVCGTDERGVGQGSYFIEDLMNLREAPILEFQDVVREPLFSPRMVHSGWGLDQYPDSQLNAIAHAGMDAILVFACGVNQTANGYLDFNDLIDRAARFGLDVYFYSYITVQTHPDEAGAEACYDQHYGALFSACPRAKGIVLVGESVEFPSHDPRTTGKPWNASNEDGLPATKPSPGWWPCRDYPQWVNRVKKVVRKYTPGADIVFWTYNWGWAPEEDRLALIRSLPADITLLVTFEMFEPVRRENVVHMCVDYTISFAGPGRYFSSEAKAAHERGLRLYTMSNTAGLTWDFGVIPYEPVPYQWLKRHSALQKAQESWGLCGLMESHHFGWWPSFVNELAKWSFWSPSPAPEEVLRQIIVRDFGAAALQPVEQALRKWSDAIRHYIPTNEDQYGPFRIGPSYPFIFQPNCSRQFTPKNIKPPAAPNAHFGSAIVVTPYSPLDNPGQSPGACRVDTELSELGEMMTLWEEGIRGLEEAVAAVPDAKRFEIMRLLNLGRFMHNCIVTTIHSKTWWKLNQRLMSETKPDGILKILDAMTALGERELQNVEETIPLVEVDSRLGWEPTMEYMTDAEHLRWKIRQLRLVMDHEIPEYRKACTA